MGAQVLQQIRAEIAEGNYQVTSEKPVVICPLAAVAKDDGSARLIHCSMPRGMSINDHATLTNKQCFDSVDDAVELIKDGYHMAKIDLKAAYRSVCIHPQERAHTGLKWHENGVDIYMYDTKSR